MITPPSAHAVRSGSAPSSRVARASRRIALLSAAMLVSSMCARVSPPVDTASAVTTARECVTLAEPGDVGNPATVWVGLVTDASRRPLRQLSADLARREIARAGGLPPSTPGGAPRPFALVACNSALGIDAAFRHLIDTLRLPAVIGPQYSGETLQALERFTLPAGAAMLATNASAPVFTSLPTRGLFLRMMASDAVQGVVLARLVRERIEPELRASGQVDAHEPVRVFLSYKSDAYGRGIAEVFERALRGDGRSAAALHDTLDRADHGDPDDPAHPVRSETVAREILRVRPHVVVLAGTREVADVVTAVERDWPTALRYRPRWVGSDGVNVIVARMQNPERSFPARLLTTSVRVDFDAPAAREWHTTLEREHPDVVRDDPRSPTALTTYEAVYAMAYAITAVRSAPLTGARIANALRALNQRGAAAADIGPHVARDVLARIARGEPVDLRGASGRLDWDRNGDVVQDVDVLCVRTRSAADGAVAMERTAPSGLYFAARDSAFAGAMGACRELPDR